MFACDISPIALSRKLVSSNAKHTFLVSEFDQFTEKVDAIICHLVLQHCDEAMVRYLLTNSYRVLDQGGIASFQFATRVGEITQKADRISEELGVIFYYTRDQIIDIVRELGSGYFIGEEEVKFAGMESLGIAWNYIGFGK
jgi:SAM-dependent methyltransferase